MLAIGSIFEQKYEVLAELGKGGMGCVYLAQDVSSGEKVAIKEQAKQSSHLKLLLSEINIQKKLNHVSLPRIIFTCDDAENVYIVMEYISGVTLNQLIKETSGFDEQRVIKWGNQLNDILIYLHDLENPVVFRDLKPSNIMIDEEDNVHLIDFGIAQEYGGENNTPKHVALTRGYAAPEQYDKRYGADVRTDIYALGVTLHYLITGKNPTTPPYHFERTRKLNPKSSYAIESIIKKCLQPNPDHRYKSAAELKKDLSDVPRLEKELAKKRARKKGFTIAACAVVAAVLIGIFGIVSYMQVQKGERYEQYMADAKECIVAGRFEEADGYLQEAVDLYPSTPDAYIQKTYLYIAEERYDEALSYAGTEILSRFEDIYTNVDFLRMMGYLYMQKGQPQEAIYYYEQVIVNAPNDTESIQYMIECMEDCGMEEEAKMYTQLLENLMQE